MRGCFCVADALIVVGRVKRRSPRIWGEKSILWFWFVLWHVLYLGLWPRASLCGVDCLMKLRF
ncbi:hypothetical protein BDW71DRAFT_189143 [Aspergillus fruticulosus]